MVQVVMPAIGAGTTHGKILQWNKQQGDSVRSGDILAEIETDKAVIELEAFDDGVLQSILVPAGDREVAVGEPIAWIETVQEEQPPAGHTAAVASPAPAAPALPDGPVDGVASMAADTPIAENRAQQPALGITDETRRVFASPSARRLARMLDVGLADLAGSGPGGRIVRIDIERAAALSAQEAPAVMAQAAPEALPTASAPLPPSLSKDVSRASAGTVVRRVAHTSMRKTIARRLQESKQQIPHFYLEMDVRMDTLLALRAQLNTALARQPEARRVSVNDLIVYIAGLALQLSPEINARWTDDAIEYLDRADVSVAVATERGLITPVVRDIGGRRLGAVATKLHDLVQRAQAGRLAPEEYQGGGLTVSNLGMFGIKTFSAIINPPQAAILAVGAVEKRPVVDGDTLGVAQVMSVTLSADHRVVDGAVGARFLARFRDLVQDPTLMLL